MESIGLHLVPFVHCLSYRLAWVNLDPPRESHFENHCYRQCHYCSRSESFYTIAAVWISNPPVMCCAFYANMNMVNSHILM